MQHYGAPTRLLDWSYSPFVATYFAIESSTGASAVWAINGDWLERKAIVWCGHLSQLCPNPHNTIRRETVTLFSSCYAPPFSRWQWSREVCVHGQPTGAKYTSKHSAGCVYRSRRCVGIFFLTTFLVFSEIGQNLVKIVIQEPVGHAVLAILYRMGISRASLYRGLDGFARSLRAKMHALRAVRTKLRFDPRSF